MLTRREPVMNASVPGANQQASEYFTNARYFELISIECIHTDNTVVAWQRRRKHINQAASTVL